jgi:proline iminopeptidase
METEYDMNFKIEERADSDAPERGASEPSGEQLNIEERLRRTAAALWSRGWVGGLVAAGLTTVWAVLVGWWMPRGPLTSGQALWSIVLSVAVGIGSGFVSRSRWMMLAGPVTFVTVVELMRLGVDGPTVDGIHFSTYGTFALVVGRVFHGLVSWLPMILGVAVGASIARAIGTPLGRSATSSRGVPVRRVVTGIAALGLLAFSLALARPARTDAIVGADGRRVPGSVAELRTVKVNGNSLAVMIRGSSMNNPVLLFLAGGPGGSELGAMRNHLKALEQRFTVVTWDQRGTGKSYSSLDASPPMTLDSVVSDTIVVTNYLRSRFGQDKIYLAGQSWGSTLGVLAVNQHPELYRAFIGTGQMVSQLETDRIFYNDTLAWAQSRNDKGLVNRLTKIGPPPYKRMLNYETALSYEHEIYPYDHSANSEGEGGFSENFLVEEYTLVEQVHLLGAFMDTFSILYPQLQGIDFRQQITRLEVPVFFVQGAHEARGRAVPFDDWYTRLDAPTKDVKTLSTSGHRPLFEQPAEFTSYMVDTVLARTQGGAK